MIVSEARRAANRRNSARSTGPTSPEGKARVRANALKHGMTAETIVDDLEAFKARAAEWHVQLKPIDSSQRWFADEVARVTLKLDHSSKVERALRDNVALRAVSCWDGDRRLEAEVLARNLADRPGEVLIRLERSVQGCEWLIGRWMMLADIADHRAEWDEAQTRLVFDLSGTPIELRGADPCVRLDADGKRVEIPGGQAGFARAEVDRLRALRDDLADLDDYDRSMTAADLSDASTPELRRFRRYEASLHSRLKWCLGQFTAAKPATATSPTPEPVAPPSRIEEKPKEAPTDEEMLAWLEKEIVHSTMSAMPTVPQIRSGRKLDRTERRREAKLRKQEPRRA